MPYLSRQQAEIIAGFLATSRTHLFIAEPGRPTPSSRKPPRRHISHTLLIASGIGSLAGAPAYAEVHVPSPGRIERRSDTVAPANPVDLPARRGKAAIERMP